MERERVTEVKRKEEEGNCGEKEVWGKGSTQRIREE